MLKALTILSCVLTAAAAPAPLANSLNVAVPQRQSLAPRQNGEVDSSAFLSELNGTLHKYKAGFSLPTYGTISSNGILKRATAEEQLTDQSSMGIDELYYGPVTVGATTPQQFTADFDTGSSDFFVPGPSCTVAQGCVGTTEYDQGGTDEHNTTSVTYGSGMITGENFFDTVTVAGLSATHTNVISLTSASGFNTSQSNSLLGMGFSTIAQSKQPTFFENLMSQGQVTNPEFSFYLGRARSNTQSMSELTLGGRDPARYSGAFTSVPVTQKGFWQVAIDGAQVHGVPALATQGQAAIDTGTTIILAPTAAATSIFALVPGAFPVPLASGSATMTIFAYPCNSNPQISLGFAGKQFAVNPIDLNLGQLTTGFANLIGSGSLLSALTAPLTGILSGGYCTAAIAGADIEPAENLYVVGDTFLKNWYSTFSYVGSASVNFAKAVGNQ